MIVTEQTPRYADMTVEAAGCLLPEADVIGADAVAVKIEQDQGIVEIIADSLSTYPTRVRLTPDEAEHLAKLLTEHAKAARAW
jgi:hypothetical protein